VAAYLPAVACLQALALMAPWPVQCLSLAEPVAEVTELVQGLLAGGDRPLILVPHLSGCALRVPARKRAHSQSGPVRGLGHGPIGALVSIIQ